MKLNLNLLMWFILYTRMIFFHKLHWDTSSLLFAKYITMFFHKITPECTIVSYIIGNITYASYTCSHLFSLMLARLEFQSFTEQLITHNSRDIKMNRFQFEIQEYVQEFRRVTEMSQLPNVQAS